jgi:hypothetical protein
MKNRQWLLGRRPDRAIKDSDFNLVETEAQKEHSSLFCHPVKDDLGTTDQARTGAI